jgi:hypothetical protein
MRVAPWSVGPGSGDVVGAGGVGVGVGVGFGADGCVTLGDVEGFGFGVLDGELVEALTVCAVEPPDLPGLVATEWPLPVPATASSAGRGVAF